MAEVLLNAEEVEAGSALDRQRKANESTGSDDAGGSTEGEAEKLAAAEKLKNESAGAGATGAGEPSDAEKLAAAEKLKNTPPPAGGPKIEDELKEIFGVDISKEDAKKLAAQLPQLKNLADQVEKLKNDQLKFASPYIQGLNEYVSKGGTKDVYDRVQALEVDKLEGIDAVKALYKWQNPGIEDGDIELYLQDKYKQGEGVTDPEKKIGGVALSIDAKKAKEELGKIKQENAVPDSERLRLQEETMEGDRLKAWQPTAKKLVDQFNSLEITLDDGDEAKKIAKTVLNYTKIEADDKKQLDEDIRNILEISGMPHNAEEMAAMKNIMQERFIVRKFPSIVKAIYQEALTEIGKRARNEYHNGNPPPPGDTPPGAGSKKSNADDLYKKQEAHLRGSS